LKGVKLKTGFSFHKTSIISQPGSFFDELQKSLTHQYPFASLRNSKFIQWRFFENPVNKYIIYAGKNRKNTPLSYAVITIQGDTATIVDIFGPCGSNEIGRLMPEVVTDLKNKNLQTIQTWLPAGHFIADELLALGFDINNEPIGIIPAVRIYHPDITPGYIDSHFFYTMADGDLL
ncbi:MAG: hypothetical protein HQ542_12945, partial [Bacteroidia bacterium]|nr:hypothetical protein [Bacteroidia bacterium]